MKNGGIRVTIRRAWFTITLVVLSLFVTGPLPVFAQNEEPLVNLFLFDTDIRDALTEISMQTGVTIIPDQTVSGLVTADIQDVPLERALRMILIGGGFTYRKVDDFYFVGLPDPRSITFGELVDSEIITLQNTTVGQVMKNMPSFLSSYITGDQNSSILTVTAPPAQLERIKVLIDQLDRPNKQIEVQVIITEVSSSVVKDIGLNLWEYTASAGQKKNDNWEAVLGLTDGIIAIETNIYGRLLANLKLLEENHAAKIHADPKVVVANGETAELFIGDRRILLVNGGETSSTRVERLEVGMTLAVTPTIVGRDQIVLEIKPEISHFVNEAQLDLVVKESALSTTITLVDGQTALLAGMTMQEGGDYSSKVPILGDIPFLRWFFRNDVDRQEEKELLIFVTPVIL